MIYIILLVLHIAVCAVILFGYLQGDITLPKYMFIVALILPFWGALLVAVLHFRVGFNPDDSVELATDKLTLDADYYKSVTVDEKKAGTTIPIEEALLINSAREKRAIIMDILNENPREYVEFLQKAGNNDDTEVVHYAVTAMVEISKENDFMLQKLEANHLADPKNPDVLAEYCDFLWSCLSENLMQGQVEVMNRELFSELSKKKIELKAEIVDFSRLIKNEITRGNLDAAGDFLKKMKKKWPESEEYILLNVQYLAELNKGQEIVEFIEKVSSDQIYLSTRTKEALAFWTD